MDSARSANGHGKKKLTCKMFLVQMMSSGEVFLVTIAVQTSRQDFCSRGGADVDPSALLLALEACHLCKKSISLTHELFMS